MKPQPLLSSLFLIVSTVMALPTPGAAATLTNRYSFTTDANDSVGGQHGALAGGASVSEGAVQLDGATGYVDLPNGLVAQRTSITIEVWLQPLNNPDWARIWDFGNSDAGEDQSGAGVTHFMCTLKPSLRATIYSGGTDSWVYSAPAILFAEGEKVHVVWTSDASTQRAHLYVNGQHVGSNPLATNTPASMGNTFNNWLGRSQFSADAYLWGAIDEFRIWDGALNSLEVAASFLSGSETVRVQPGSIGPLTLQLSPEMVRGNTQQAAVLTSVVGLTNDVDIAEVPGVTFETSNRAVLTVDTYGKVTAAGTGTASITVRYSGQSASTSVTVSEKPTVLLHRYSFTVDANDFVGTAHGTLQGGAVVENGRVLLDPAGESHVQLPAGILGDARALTIETWASFGTVATWSRLWHFGDQNSSGTARYYVELCPRGSANDFFMGVSDSDPGGAHADSVARAGALVDRENVHVTAVFNPLGGYDALYLNGALVGRNLNPTVRDLTKVQDILNYIGRSLYAADPYLDGSVDELRIYDGALAPIEVAVSAAFGPGQPHRDPGPLQSIRLALTNTLALDARVTASVLATYFSLTNFDLIANSLSGVPGLTLTSSDTNVLVVQANGLVRAATSGSATLTADYQGKTSTVAVTVTRPLATLKHRYSFTTNANDSVGAAHGTLAGNASVAGGKVLLDGSDGTYVDLPGGLVSGLSAVTVEFWADLQAEPSWSRVFDFGDTVDNNGTAFLFYSPRTGSSAQRFAISTSAGTVDLDAPGVLENQSVHVACVYDPAAGFMGIYTNGVLELSNANARVPLSGVGAQFSYIGRSLFAADAYLNATIDEFRIYEGRLYPDEIATTHALGPDQLPGAAATLSVRLDGANVRISWPASAGAYTVETTAVLGPGANWTAVADVPTTVGDRLEVPLPTGGKAGYYRLRR